MSERFDAEILSPHDLDVMRGRVSFEPHEVNTIVDEIHRLQQVELAETTKAKDIAGDLRGRVVELVEILGDDKIYRLKKSDAVEITNLLQDLNDVISRLENEEE